MVKNSNEPAPPDPLYWESNVALRLGLSRTRLRQMRQRYLEPSVHFQFESSAVVLTPAGLAKIEAILAQGEASDKYKPRPAEPNGGHPAVPPGPPPKALLMVVRKPLHRVDSPQTKLLICREVPAGTAPTASWLLQKVNYWLSRERPVRVRDNSNFQPGMILEAVNIGSGMLQYVGRLPRRLGRW